MLTTTNERLGRAAFWSAVILSALHAAPGRVSAETIHLRCGTRLDGISDASRENVTIRVEGNRITALGPCFSS